MKKMFIMPSGEVAKRLEKLKVPVFLFVLLYLLIPVIVYIVSWVLHGFSIISTALVILWIIWSIYAWVYLSLTNNEHSIVVGFFLTFPIVVPFLFITTIIIRYLMKRYPNTNDPEEIKKFNRKVKIKSIL